MVHRIYPRSVNDTDGDGIDDLAGIVEKVAHLDELRLNQTRGSTQSFSATGSSSAYTILSDST